jgi:hypothetical protein
MAHRSFIVSNVTSAADGACHSWFVPVWCCGNGRRSSAGSLEVRAWPFSLWRERTGRPSLPPLTQPPPAPIGGGVCDATHSHVHGSVPTPRAAIWRRLVCRPSPLQGAWGLGSARPRREPLPGRGLCGTTAPVTAGSCPCGAAAMGDGARRARSRCVRGRFLSGVSAPAAPHCHRTHSHPRHQSEAECVTPHTLMSMAVCPRRGQPFGADSCAAPPPCRAPGAWAAPGRTVSPSLDAASAA